MNRPQAITQTNDQVPTHVCVTTPQDPLAPGNPYAADTSAQNCPQKYQYEHHKYPQIAEIKCFEHFKSEEMPVMDNYRYETS